MEIWQAPRDPDLDKVPYFKLQCDWIDVYLMQPNELRHMTPWDFVLDPAKEAPGRPIRRKYRSIRIKYVPKVWEQQFPSTTTREAAIQRLKQFLFEQYCEDIGLTNAQMALLSTGERLYDLYRPTAWLLVPPHPDLDNCVRIHITYEFFDMFMMQPLEYRNVYPEDFVLNPEKEAPGRRVRRIFRRCKIKYVQRVHEKKYPNTVTREASILRLKEWLFEEYRHETKLTPEEYDRILVEDTGASLQPHVNSSGNAATTNDVVNVDNENDAMGVVEGDQEDDEDDDDVQIIDMTDDAMVYGRRPSTAAMDQQQQQPNSGDDSDRMLRRMSSVSLKNDGSIDENEVTTPSRRVLATPSRAGDRKGDGSHDDLMMPLSCVTQEKLLHPRKRPPSGALYHDSSEHSRALNGWKRRSCQPSPASKRNFLHESLVPRLADVKPPSASLFPKSLNLYAHQMADEAVGTLLIYQPTCLDHHNDTHQENRSRLTVLCGPDGVLTIDRFKNIKWANLNELKPARLNDMLRVHTYGYLKHLQESCSTLPAQDDSITVGNLCEVAQTLTYAEWAKSEKAAKCYEVQDPPSSGSFDMDAPISSASYMAARFAAGAVCHAIDKVLNRDARNAFVAVRPPGHHAGPNGCVESEGFNRRPEMCTCGFCLLNNVAIGAAYAMCAYAPPFYTQPSDKRRSDGPASVQRVAIVDFDIHHGNGTEDIIRNLVPHKKRYPLPSSWAPVEFDSYMPWRDEHDLENVYFASIHLYDDDNFYPCSGAGPNGCSAQLKDHPNILNLPMAVLGPRYLEDRLKLSVKAKRTLMEEASKIFRQIVSEKLIPSLRAFRPDLILISAGFDGHADDFYYFLSEDDYGWITNEILVVANECCDGRVVSVLEGGYNVVPAQTQKQASRTRSRPGNSNFHFAAKLHNREVDEELSDYGSLARSCAAHVSALQDAARNSS